VSELWGRAALLQTQLESLNLDTVQLRASVDP
jgi:hypothetical protein